MGVRASQQAREMKIVAGAERWDCDQSKRDVGDESEVIGGQLTQSVRQLSMSQSTLFQKRRGRQTGCLTAQSGRSSKLGINVQCNVRCVHGR